MSAPDAGLSRQAMRLYQNGQFAQAEPLLKRLQQADTGNWQYPLLLGLCRRGQGDAAGALEWLRRAVAVGDGQTATHYQLGRLLAETGDTDGAREQFGQVTALDPNHVDARTAMAEVSLLRGQFQRAASEFKVALRAKADHVPALTGLARAHMEQGELEEARQLLQGVLERDASHPVALMLAGRMLLAAGRFDEAERCFTDALKRAPNDIDTHALLARLLARRGRHAEAVQHFGRVLSGAAATPEIVIDLAESLRRLGDLGQARQLLTDAAAHWTDRAELVLKRAELEAALGQPERARELLDSLDGEQPEVALARARIEHNHGNAETAKALLESLIDAEPAAVADEARMLLAMERARAEPADLDHARAAIAPLLEREPPDATALLGWATICDRLGDHQQARSSLEALLARADENSGDARMLHTALGNTLDRLDDRPSAWTHWQAGGWRDIPIAARLNQQARVVRAWLDAGRLPEPSAPFDDDRPAPVIVAGWPGSGRVALLAGLAAHPGVQVLAGGDETRRLEALNIPAGPAELAGLTPENLRLARKRFLRGVRLADAHILLEAGWWSAAMLPALLLAFPEARIVLPTAAIEDMRVQWLNDGYRQIDALVEAYQRDLQLIDELRAQMQPNLIEIDRARVVAEPVAAFAQLCQALGLETDEAADQAVRARCESMRFVPAGHGQRYAEWIGSGAQA
ncbi:MAG: tetratricopeptide repeat protein [Wenzhouxiangellaceae bacterium]|nr:tetratricopeptide repeat protein [Wenzhouxiangellaceae bacterium]